MRVRVLDPNNGNAELVAAPVMVRVRKNAEALTPTEVQRFLAALAELHKLATGATGSEYVKYARAHAEPFSFLHGNPGFLPWHRAFLLSLERDLQKIDPRVALPYWKFEAPAPKLFSADFIGRVDVSLPWSDPNRTLVQFSATNPINGWGMPDAAGGMDLMVRDDNADVSAPIVLPGSPLGEPDYRLMWSLMEDNYHNDAHNHVGGWMATGSSPRDPLFFLLHANVDRAWAAWQSQHNRFQVPASNAPPTDPLLAHYAPHGSYPGPGVPRYHAGVYAEDSLWPWNLLGGNQGTADPLDDWPTLVFPLATATGSAAGPPIKPRAKDMIDYWNFDGTGAAHDVAYDDVPYKP